MDEILREMNKMRIDELEQLILRAQLLIKKKEEDEREQRRQEKIRLEQERIRKEKERHEEMERLERRLKELKREEEKEFHCPKCGKAIASDSRFCCFCGFLIKNS